MEISAVDIVNLTIAAGALALGIVNYTTELFRRKPRAKIACRNYLDTAGRVGLTVTVENAGERPITISGVGVVLKGDKRLHPRAKWGDELPKVLQPDETCETVIDHRCYADVIRYMKCAFAWTPIGAEFYSKRFPKEPLGIK